MDKHCSIRSIEEMCYFKNAKRSFHIGKHRRGMEQHHNHFASVFPFIAILLEHQTFDLTYGFYRQLQ